MKKIKIATLVVCVWVFLIHAPVAGAQTVGLAVAAIEHHNGVSLHKWRFDRLSTVDDQRWRERCVGVDFHKADCRLLTVDDQPADAAAQRRYLKKHPQPVDNNLPNIDLDGFVNAATLNLDERVGGSVRFSFDGAADTPDDYATEGRLKGVMQVDQEGGFVESLSLSNSEAYNPAPGVKVKQYALDIQFANIEERVFATRVSLAVKGRAFGLKKFEQNQIVSFENFTPPP